MNAQLEFHRLLWMQPLAYLNKQTECNVSSIGPIAGRYLTENCQGCKKSNDECKNGVLYFLEKTKYYRFGSSMITNDAAQNHLF